MNDAIRAIWSKLFGQVGYKGDANYTVSSYVYTMVSYCPYIIEIFSTDVRVL